MSMKVYLGMKVDEIRTRIKNRGEKKERIDLNLPLDLRFGSRVQISEAPFLLTGDETPLLYPGPESLIGAFSESTMAGMKTFRLYLKDREDSSQESMLMILMADDEKAVDEVYLFREFTEVPLYYVALDEIPNDGDEANAVDFWIGKAEGILGMPLFHTPDELTYERLWEPDRDARIPPLTLNETVNMDPYAESTMEIEHLGTMLYARTFEGIGMECDEYLLPTVEKDDDGFRVRIWVGMQVSESDLSFPDAL